jgi:hypothetical protein
LLVYFIKKGAQKDEMGFNRSFDHMLSYAIQLQKINAALEF